MDEATAERVRNLLDRDAILQVLLRNARGLDRMDDDLLRACYFDDAIDDHGHYVGPPDGFIRYGRLVSEQYRSTQHTIGNHVCEVEGDDAWSETCFQFIGVAERPPHLFACGRYVDHFQRRNGEWRIANRITLIEGRFDLLDSTSPGSRIPAYGPDESDPARRDRNDISYHRPPRPRQPRSA